MLIDLLIASACALVQLMSLLPVAKDNLNELITNYLAVNLIVDDILEIADH